MTLDCDLARVFLVGEVTAPGGVDAGGFGLLVGELGVEAGGGGAALARRLSVACRAAFELERACSEMTTTVRLPSEGSASVRTQARPAMLATAADTRLWAS